MKLARKRKQSRRSVRLEFAAIEVTGGLLPNDLIGQIASGDASEQTDESYGISPSLKLRDEISRYFQIAQAHWDRFQVERDANTSSSIFFVQKLLRDCFGFSTLENTSPKVISDRKFPVNFAAERGRVPVVIAPPAQTSTRKSGVDEALPVFGDDSRRRSSSQLLQEYLNADEDALWGLTSDGSTLRVMRDNASLTRPAWIEIDLEKIFSENLFPDFSVVWLLMHASRFGAFGSSPSDCPLERWKERSRIDGAAAKENLRLGVEAALIELGRGFIQNASNATLRESLQTGELKVQSYYEELLRLVYRLIFIFAAEDRDLLHRPGATLAAKRAYSGGYSLARLRERCTKNAALDKNIDAWEGMKSVFQALAEGEAALGLEALGGLFEPNKLADLIGCKIENKRFLKAVWHLSWFRPEGQPMTKVNWRDMETEELGSVYESLLELTPQLDMGARDFTFAEGDATRGNARKVSGSYYTPDSLVKLLLDNTLDPVLDQAEARNPEDPVSEILKLSIIDPACGSGHFLLGAARRAANRIARHRMPGALSKEAFQHALREVVSRCIYGVDRNPMAIELCKVALWIEALEPGKPLSFLDSQIQVGDSLIGVFDFEMLKNGVPNEAFTALSGDQKEVAKAYKRLNKDERDGKAATGFIGSLAAPKEIIDDAKKLAEMPEDTLRQVKAKARAFRDYQRSDQRQNLKIACDLYVAAFFAAKTGEIPEARTLSHGSVPTTGAVWEALSGYQRSVSLVESAEKIASDTLALHWPLAFPAVMANGGFDAVIGNPPWERIKLQEQEFFAARDPEIANAKNKAARDRLINALAEADDQTQEHQLFLEFIAARRNSEAGSLFARKSGRFPLTGVGDVNTYPLFAELFTLLARQSTGPKAIHDSKNNQLERDNINSALGVAGLIVPTGIATDSSTSAFFESLISGCHLKSFIGFSNKKKLFAEVGSMVTFAILIIGSEKSPEFSFFIQDTVELHNRERRFRLTPEQVVKINPNTKTAPVFRSRADAELTAKLYGKAPVLIEERADHPEGDKNPWGISFQTMFHMSNDSDFFRGAEDLGNAGFLKAGTDWEHSDGRRYVPLYEAKMVHHYDHRWATYEGDGDDESIRDVTLVEKQNRNFEPSPRYWVPKDEVDLRSSRVPSRLKTAFVKEDPDSCLKILAEWVLGSCPGLDLHNPTVSIRDAELHLKSVLGPYGVSSSVVGQSFQSWFGKSVTKGAEMQCFTPFSEEDLAFIRDYGPRWVELVGELIDRQRPRWLMGWRDICRSTDERTLISSTFATVGTGDTLLLFYSTADIEQAIILPSLLSSLTLDYICRQKIGGTHLKYNVFKQNAVLPPSVFQPHDFEWAKPRILELTYTSNRMKAWAEDLGYFGPPFGFDPARRANLRAELDAFFALKYELTKDELRYVLDPQDAKGEDYPSETFRILKNKETKQFGEYRTQRLVLEAFDRMTGA